MIRKAATHDAASLAGLAACLWQGHNMEQLQAEFEDLVGSDEAACFLAEENGTPVGFAQCQKRHDYVEGTSTSPVGYLEGIFVREAFRNHGIARQLLESCERWAKAQGCREFASDCELGNNASLRFHLCIGFEEANRIICFSKVLAD